MSTTNAYCKALGIQVPRLEAVRTNPDANYYSLLIAAVLERGEPITLEEAAARFEEAGVAPSHEALASLKRCKPARPPLYRDGNCYALDPHDHEADLWAFRLGLRPPRVAAPQVVRPDPGPLPSRDEPLTVADLDEAWREGVLHTWSAQRIAIAVLDAHATVAARLELDRAHILVQVWYSSDKTGRTDRAPDRSERAADPGCVGPAFFQGTPRGSPATHCWCIGSGSHDRSPSAAHCGSRQTTRSGLGEAVR